MTQGRRDLMRAAVWIVAALIVAGCALSVWLGTADWGDGGGAKLSTLEVLGLIAGAVAAGVAALVVDARLRP